MSSSQINRSMGESSKLVRRRLQVDDEIIRIPAFDNSDLIALHKRTLVGRIFHREGRSVEALIAQLPKRRIWDMEGRVRGLNLGNGKFQFDFDRDEDMQKVLDRRPCHFNKWSFSLEKWEPNISANFPNTMVFWATISGIPTHYRKDEVYRGIGKALGAVIAVDVDRARVKVSVNADAPLQFDRRVGFENGDVIQVKIIYEDLFRWCYTCGLISHLEGTCPELTAEQREEKRRQRLEQKMDDEAAAREMFSYHGKHEINRARPQSATAPSLEKSGSSPPISKDIRSDLRKSIQEKRESRSKEVWRRIENPYTSNSYRSKERYHPYSVRGNEFRSFRQAKENSPSYWRRKDHGDKDIHKKAEEDISSSRKIDNSQSRSFGRPPDSQRTISESYGYQRRAERYGAERYGNDRRNRVSSPKRVTQEWRPVQKPQDSSILTAEKNKNETEEEMRRRKGKGLAVQEMNIRRTETESSDIRMEETDHVLAVTPNSNKYGTSSTLEPGEIDRAAIDTSDRLQCTEQPSLVVQAENEMSISPDKGQNKGDIHTDKTLNEEGRNDKLPEDLDNEKEIDNLLVQYADLEMDDEMVECDDLLEDDLAEDIHPGEDRIEALSQIQVSSQVPTATKIDTGKSSELSEGNLPEKTISKIPGSGIKGRKKAGRSPDPKSLLASKKIQNHHARASPRKKASQPRHNALTRAELLKTKVPRMEVVPPMAIKNKAANSGSVVSQKPPSKRI